MNNGEIRKVDDHLTFRDYLGMVKMRLGIGRNRYRVKAGLYAFGAPDKSSKVFVSCNYKYSFDLLRNGLRGLDAWILVLETRGINVWCAAGKGTFGTDELVNRIKLTGLENVVDHKELILPQLGAVGVSAHTVKKLSGFKVVYGPIRASDISAFLKNNKVADEKMRSVTFGLFERAMLIPNEIKPILKVSFFVIIGTLFLSGTWMGTISLDNVSSYGLPFIMAYLTGVFCGTVLATLLLPYIPGRALSFKGAFIGLIGGFAMALAYSQWHSFPFLLSLVLISSSVSSYLAMVLTGSTPYTSPSGVELEMRRGIPLQILSVIGGLILWVHELWKI